MAADRRHGKGPLGPVIAEAGALAAGDREGGHAAGPQRGLARRLGPGPGRRVSAMRRQALVGRGRQALQVDRRATPPRDKGADEAVDLGQVDLGRLGQEARPGLRGQLVEKGEDLALAGAAKGSQ